MPTRYIHLTLLNSTATGFWTPRHCIARERVALIVPFRDREQHLRIFLNVLHPLLQRQQIEYTIFLVEQVSIGDGLVRGEERRGEERRGEERRGEERRGEERRGEERRGEERRGEERRGEERRGEERRGEERRGEEKST